MVAMLWTYIYFRISMSAQAFLCIRACSSLTGRYGRAGFLGMVLQDENVPCVQHALCNVPFHYLLYTQPA